MAEELGGLPLHATLSGRQPITLRGTARDPDGQAGALLVGRGQFETGDERFAELHEQRPFEVELSDGRRLRVEADHDTALWLPSATRTATVGALRASCPEAAQPLASEADSVTCSYRWALLRDGDPVAVVAVPLGTRLVLGTGGPRTAPQQEADPTTLRADAIAAGRHAASVLERITSGEDRRVSALGLALIAGGCGLVAWALTSRESVAMVGGGVGLGIVVAGAATWWMGLGVPRSRVGLEILTAVACCAPCVTWLPFTWPALAVIAALFWRWSGDDAAVFRAIRDARSRGQLRILRDHELTSLGAQRQRLIVGGSAGTGPPVRGVALVAEPDGATLVVPPGRTLAIERWLGRRAMVGTVLLAAAVAGMVLLFR